MSQDFSEKPFHEYFVHCPNCGYRKLESVSQCPFLCENCGIEMFFNSVTSVAALIENSAGNVLFTRRKQDPQRGKLGIPGGFVNPGENLEEALLREVHEEVGIELKSWSYLGGWPNQYSYKSVIYSVTDIYFVAQVEDFESIKTCPDEVDGEHIANPVTIELDDLAFPTLKAAVSKYLKNRYSN